MNCLKGKKQIPYLCQPNWILFLIGLFFSNLAFTQLSKIDSLRNEIKIHQKHDALWLSLNVELANQYLNIFPDSIGIP